MAHSSSHQSLFFSVKKWSFHHIASSPGFPQPNRKVENALKTTKTIMSKAKWSGGDPWLALLDFRNAPTQGLSHSPVQHLTNRRIRGLLPMSEKLLEPRVSDNEAKKQENKTRQAFYYNKG
jgi:hypothetical protein